MERIECIDHFRKKTLDYYRYFSQFVVNENNLFKKYFNEHQKKIFIYMIVGIVSLTIVIGIYDNRDEEEKLIDFGEYQNYQVNKINLPTKGDVILIKKLPSREYSIKSLKDGNVELTGYFYYEIRPQTIFAPKLYHSDMHGNTLENSNYWASIGYGSVILRMKER